MKIFLSKPPCLSQLLHLELLLRKTESFSEGGLKDPAINAYNLCKVIENALLPQFKQGRNSNHTRASMLILFQVSFYI